MLYYSEQTLPLLLQVLIDVETYEYFSVHSKGSEGVLVLVQHYRDIPLMRKESFVLGPGSGKSERESKTSSSSLRMPGPTKPITLKMQCT